MGQADAGIEWGPYHILGELAKGALATVHLARYTEPEGATELRVIKRLHASIADSPRVLEAIRNESRRSALLRHRHVARIHGFGALGSSSAIAMEFVDGRPLLDLRTACEQRGRRVPRALALQITRDLCEALNHAHNLTDPMSNQRQIIHHGVSLENIMVTYTGEVKVTNFGMARIGLTDTFVGQMEQRRSCPAPELIQGTQLDPRLDIFAAGVVLYEILLGRMPWSAQTYTQLLRRILASPPLRPSSLDPKIPPELEELLLRAIQQQRERRYQTISDLQQDLERMISSAPEQARVPTPARPALAEYMNELFPVHRDPQRRAVRALTTLRGKPALTDGNTGEDPLEGAHTQVKSQAGEQTRRVPRHESEGASTQVRSLVVEQTWGVPESGPAEAPAQVQPPPRDESAGEKQPRPLPLLKGMNPGLSLEQTPIVHIENLAGLLETVRAAKSAAADQLGADPPPTPEAEEPTQVRSLAQSPPQEQSNLERGSLNQGPLNQGSLNQGPLLPVKTPAVPIAILSPHLKASRFKDTGKVQSISGQTEEEPTTVRRHEEALLLRDATADGVMVEPALGSTTGDGAEGKPTAIHTARNPPEPRQEHEDQRPGQDRRQQAGREDGPPPEQDQTSQGVTPITEEVVPRQPQRSRALLLTLGGFILLTAGGLCYWTWGDESQPRQRASIGVIDQPTPSVSSPEPDPPDVAVGQPESPEATRGSTARQPPSPVAADLRSTGSHRRRPPEEPPGNAPARISILAPQPGVVFLDGERLGALPVTNRSIPPGQHRLLVRSRHRRYEVYRRISVEPGVRRTWRISPARGTIKVLVHPWAKVFLDGKEVGITPLKPLSAFQGPHTLRLENSQLGQKKTVRVVVRPGKIKVVKVRLGN